LIDVLDYQPLWAKQNILTTLQLHAINHLAQQAKAAKKKELIEVI